MDNMGKDKKTKTTIVFTATMFWSLMVGVLLISFIVGGLTGLVAGSWAQGDSQLAAWLEDSIFQKTSSQETGTTQTIQVVEDSATVDVVKQASPAVVSIVVTQDLSELYNSTGQNIFPFGDLFNFDFPQQTNPPEGKQEVGAGTGFIIGDDGLIVTNKHVVSEAGAEYTVVLNDGSQHEATVLDTDPFNDLALIKIEATGLPVLELGDSDSLEIGQTVIAIGNTLGQYSNTVTRGVVSGLSRTVTAGDGNGRSETLEDIIQTDAAINSGNSGGPLLNLAGQVIGVNTAINREGQSIGFTIPINQAKNAIENVKEFGRIIRPYLGVRYVLVTSEIAEQNNLDVDHGALIVRGAQPADLAIIPGSPADKAGLVENDIILEVNGQQIDNDHSLAKELQKNTPGDTVTLKVLSKGEEKTVPATLAELED